MEVKSENGGTFNAAGSGTTGLAITGTVLGGAALAGMGLFNGLLGNPNNCSMEKIGKLQSELDKVKAEQYTDKAVIAQAGRDAEAQKALYKDLIDIGVGLTRVDCNVKNIDKDFAYRDQINDLRFKALEDKINCAITLESERRINGDQGLYGYVNGTFVPGKMIMPVTNVCPQPMPLYNAWEAPTTTTPAA